MGDIKSVEKYPIKLFIASGVETKEIREKIRLELEALNDVYEKTKFCFKPVVWEAESSAWSKRTQDDYNKLIADCQMVAVVIKNTLGKFTQEEFNVAREKYEKSGEKRSPKVMVYTLPSNSDNKDRHKFINSFKKKGSEYFRCPVENEYELIDKIKNELTRIKNEFETELNASVESAQETVERLNLDGELTREAVELFEAGDYKGADSALDIDKVRERAEKVKSAQTEVAEAFVLKAKLELTNVTNPDRFKTAEALFEEAVGVIRSPEILFEYAYFCMKQNIFQKAIKLFEEALALFRELGDSYNVAMTLGNLGNLHDDMGDYEKAEDEYNEALIIKRKLAEDNPDVYEPDVATTLNNLGELHRKNNDYKKAETEYNEALELSRKLGDSANVATTLNNLGILHYDNSDYEKAEEEYNEALAIRCKFVEDNPAVHEPYVATTLNNLAILHSDNNDYEKAETEYNEALELYRKFAEDNPAVYEPDVAGTLNNLGNLHNVNGDYKKAEVEYNEALGLLTPFYEAYPNVHGELYDMITRGLAELEELTAK